MNLLLVFLVSTFALLALLERVFPARHLPRVRRWHVKGLVFLGLSYWLSTRGPLLWDGTLARHTLIDATGLGHVGGVLVGLAVLQLGVYVWHRLLHRVPFLWRHFHQMHHSAERLDVWGSFYFHPLDALGFALVGSVALVLVLGLTLPAALTAGLVTMFCNVFQHANIRTPRWLGYLVQRPESHSLHHARGVHRFNYGDLPLWDLVFRTFRNPREFVAEQGFWDGASERVLPMLVGRDVSEPPGRAAQAESRRSIEQARRMVETRTAG